MPQIEPIDDNYIDEVIKSAEPYNQAINKTQGVKLRELIKKLRDYFEEKISGSSGLISITYVQLVSKMENAELIAGANYLLSDYQMAWKSKSTVYFNDGTTGNYPVEVFRSGVIEPLILTAISPTQIHAEAKSTIYKNDIIYYSIGFNGSGYQGVDYYQYLEGSVIPETGIISRRIDTYLKNDICFDYRAYKLKNVQYDYSSFLLLNPVNVTIKLVTKAGDSSYVPDGMAYVPNIHDISNSTLILKGQGLQSIFPPIPVYFNEEITQLNVLDSYVEFLLIYVGNQKKFNVNINNSYLKNLYVFEVGSTTEDIDINIKNCTNYLQNRNYGGAINLIDAFQANPNLQADLADENQVKHNVYISKDNIASYTTVTA
ncbi:hypothetical protein [Pedobacter sp. UBA5917]|jgi:hypothetical protein|uniref:hypothetical protein n=1 Tax=Pedobacter sp. UBA5917 TaxID=1947061 RepID=UPI0025FB7001|nr:hypothetical protein [Pedobacter sp. UBA5917]